MDKTLKRNCLISLAIAVVTGGISHFTTNFSLMETLRWSLYDFFLLQTFLIVLEIYKDYISEAHNLMKQEKYNRLIQNLNQYEKDKESKDAILDGLLSVLIEECIQYSRLESANGQSISMHLAELLTKKLSAEKSHRRVVCPAKKFNKAYISRSTELIVLYEAYTDIYASSVNFSELSEKYDIQFYRKRENVLVEPFCLIDNILLMERDERNCWIYTDAEEIKRYLEKYKEIREQAVPFGMTQDDDSLFMFQSIKEFYGPGNLPCLHLDKIKEPFRKILDIGTGSGRVLEYFVDSTKYDVIAMDKDRKALEDCKKRYGRYNHISIETAEFTENSFKADMFDLVIAFNSLYHTTRANIYDRIKRVSTILKDGGYFILTLKTLEGNEDIYRNAHELIPEKPEHTYLDTLFPDSYLPHHFCDSKEIDLYIKMFSEVVYYEEIPLKMHDNDIVQGKGVFYILKK